MEESGEMMNKWPIKCLVHFLYHEFEKQMTQKVQVLPLAYILWNFRRTTFPLHACFFIFIFWPKTESLLVACIMCSLWCVWRGRDRKWSTVQDSFLMLKITFHQPFFNIFGLTSKVFFTDNIPLTIFQYYEPTKPIFHSSASFHQHVIRYIYFFFSKFNMIWANPDERRQA